MNVKESLWESWVDCGDLCFSNLGATEFAAMINSVVVRSIERDAFFVRQGQYCKYVAFVASGMLRHFHYEQDKEITKWIALPGTFSTSMLSFVTHQPSLENIQAIEDTELYCLSQSSWLKLCRDFPAFVYQWRLKIESHYFSYANCSPPEQRYLILSQKYPKLIEKAPRKYIASMLGIEPWQLNKIINAKKAGVEEC